MPRQRIQPDGPNRSPLLTSVRRLINDAALLIRQEIQLFRLEMATNIRNVGKNFGRVAVGGGIAGVGVLAFAAFLIIGLGALLGDRYWLSSLIVALGLLGGGGGLAYLGGSRIAEAFAPPRRTIASVRETGEWAGQEVRELKAALGSGDVALQAGGSASPAALLGDTTETGTALVKSQGPKPPGPRKGGGRSPLGTRLPLSTPFVRRVLHEIGEDDVLGQAAKVAFFMFLSLPPALMVLFGLTGLFGGESVAQYLTNQIEVALPGSADQENSAASLVSTFVDQVVNQNAPGPLSIGILLGLWSASAVFVSITEALNMAFDVPETRSWFKRRGMAVGVMFLFVLLFLTASVLLIAGPHLVGLLGFGEVGTIVWNIAQWPAAFLLVSSAFFLVYYVLPNRNQSTSKRVLFRSSALVAALWLIATTGFRTYIANFGSYSESYGFVGAILVLLLWMYVTGIVLLVGGEIASEMERSD